MVLDHIGIAVASLEARLAFYRLLGLEASGREVVATQKVEVAFLPLGGTRIELLQPTSPDSPIATFLAKRGEGLHHIALQVEDVAAVMAQLQGAGVALLSEVPLEGAHGSQICFVHPKSTGGVLLELCQPGR